MSFYIFGYGSLMHPPSIAETIPSVRIDPPSLFPASLEGYERGFTAIAANQAGFRLEDKSEEKLVCVAYMNVLPQQGRRSLGVVFAVSPSDLTALDRREAIYDRVDVTTKISFPPSVTTPLQSGDTVYTYVSQSNLQDHQHGCVGFGADYERIIGLAHQHIDQQLGTDEYTQDFAAILDRYPWPRFHKSNPRSEEGYPD